MGERAVTGFIQADGAGRRSARKPVVPIPRYGHQKGESDVSTPDPDTGLDDPGVEATAAGGATQRASSAEELHDLWAMLARLLDSAPAVSRVVLSAPVIGPAGQAAKGVARSATQISVPTTTLCRDTYRGLPAVFDAVANVRWVAHGAAATTRAGARRLRGQRATGPGR
jgi:hypothetical protein